MLSRCRSLTLGPRMALAACLGLALGALLGEHAAALAPVRTLINTALALLAPPLVLVLSLGALVGVSDRTGRRSLAALGAFGLAAVVAALVGAAAGGLLRWLAPGSPLTSHAATGAPGTVPPRWTDQAVPGALLVALAVGTAVQWAGRAGQPWSRPLAAALRRLADHTLALVVRSLAWAPLVVFLLAATVAGQATGPAARMALAALLAVYLAQAVLVVLLLLAARRAQLSPQAVLGGCQDALWAALVSGSSAASLPCELRAVEQELGVGAGTARVLVPLGLVVGKAGTTAFLAALLGVCGGGDRGPWSWCLIVPLAMAGGVVTPPVAGGGLLVLAFLAQGIGLPPELGAWCAAVPFLGRFNTPVNALGRMLAVVLAAQSRGWLRRAVDAGAPSSG